MNKELVVVNKPKSSSSEAIRTLRTNLQFTFGNNDKNVLLVTSSIPGEGKSFVSANLASAFGLIDYNVIVIDCDMRKGRQNKLFELDNEKGLSNLLIDDISNYKNYIKKTKVDNVSVITSGIIPPNPSELLGSDNFKKLITELNKKYSLIILDCPPINCITDALVLTNTADEVLLCSAYKITPLELLNDSKKALANAGAKIAGVVFNKVPNKSNDYYYSKYYK